MGIGGSIVSVDGRLENFIGTINFRQCERHLFWRFSSELFGDRSSTYVMFGISSASQRPVSKALERKQLGTQVQPPAGYRIRFACVNCIAKEIM
ncbi:hypothetical protein RP75_23895 [Agrobacterium arsenijevicii]|uniref:Uncharacterized protein n=1 Tax=Agrobacterium arsenijevicii TaxID=1585697 RepID=A0ABR5D1F0_9HYPH|nr:hypothetical protein RP75_23895 [Agrobacterium arsenijevicii]